MLSTPKSTALAPARRGWLKGLGALLTGGLLLGKSRAAAARPAEVFSTNGAKEIFLGEIIMVAFDFPPRGFALCNGQLLPINQNQALFALLSTSFGGDGRTTIALPNLNGRVPIGAGQGLGLSYRALGDTGGSATVTLLPSQIPAHTHSAALTYSTAQGTTGSPANAFLASNGSGLPQYTTTSTGITTSGTLADSQPHNNEQPYQVLGFISRCRAFFLLASKV